MYPAFSDHIAAMNAVYELPNVKSYPFDMAVRLQQFRDILAEECNEIYEILEDTRGLLAMPEGAVTSADILRLRTGLADLLGDIIVYCASEAKRWNIPLDEVLAVIMSSNFSKLDTDGKPIKDERGKFLKGPNYWKPEPLIAAVIGGSFHLDMGGFGADCYDFIPDLQHPGQNITLPPPITRVSTSPTDQPDSGSQAAESHP
jgi:hypothetical protein